MLLAVEEEGAREAPGLAFVGKREREFMEREEVAPPVAFDLSVGGITALSVLSLSFIQ